MIDLSIIIVTYNSEEDLPACLDSVRAAQGDLNLEVLVVDNLSRDGTVALITSRYAWVDLTANASNLGFAGGNNVALPKVRGRHVLLLNPDTLVEPGAFQALATCLDRHPEFGIVGPALLDADGEEWADLRQPSLGLLVMDLFGLTRFLPRRVADAELKVVSGACMMFRAGLIGEIGMLDAAMHTYEDNDFCQRAGQRGYRIAMVRRARVRHLCGKSARTNVGFVIEKGYSSLFRYAGRHLGRTEGVLIFGVMLVDAGARWVKWRCRGLLCPSAEARTRVAALGKSIAGMPRMFAEGRREGCVPQTGAGLP